MNRNSPSQLEQQLANRWAEVFRQHQSWLWTVIRSRVACREEAADILQEVACALMQQRQSPEDIQRLEPWLYRLVLRQVLMHRRRVGRMRKHQQRWSAQQSPDDSMETDGLVWVLREESRAQVRQAVGDLRPGDRDVLLLKYVERWSYERIAHHLGLSRHAVEYRLQRARQVLRHRLADFANTPLGSVD